VEPAYKTLRRLSVSLLRRVRSVERKLNPDCQYHACKNADKVYYYHRQAQGHHQPGVSASVWIQKGDADNEVGTLDADGTELDKDGYIRYHLSKDLSIAHLWETICDFPSSKLSIRLRDDDYESHFVLSMIPFPPTIIAIRTFENFKGKVFVGVPMVVEVQVQHASRAVVVWFADGAVVSLDSPVYTPNSNDIGKKLSVFVFPILHDQSVVSNEEAYEFENRVEPLPYMPLVSPLRDCWAFADNEARPEHLLRVMTYNLLADMYASRETDQIAMYNHCESQYLSRKRRMPMLMYEILAYRPDVVCLQEVDSDVFESLFRPVMESQGYQGYYSNKASAQLEGCALFWSLNCFHPVTPSKMRKFYLKDLFQHHKHNLLDRWESLGDIDRLLDENAELGRITKEKTGQVLQVVELRPLARKPSIPERIVIGNTHLFYHPLADHVRAMQAYMVCRQLEIERYRNGIACPFIIGGDLNSNPLSGAVELLLWGRVGPANHDAFKNLETYQWGMGDEEFLLEHGYIGNAADSGTPAYEEEAFEDALESLNDEDSGGISGNHQPTQIRLPSSFPRLFLGYTDCPTFTNYSVDFMATLDYILATSPSPTETFGFLPSRAAPMPTIKNIKPMPNEHMPSDHVSLVCDLEWTRYNQIC